MHSSSKKFKPMLIYKPTDESVDIKSQAEYTLFLTALGGVPTEAEYKAAFKGEL